MTSRYSWLLFDADGTILDYDAAEAHSLETAASSFGLEISPAILELYREINSALWADLERGKIDSLTLRVKRFRTLASRMDWDIREQDFSDRYLDELGRSGFTMTGARDMLDALPPDVNKVIITNGIRDTQHGRLKYAGLTDYFPYVIVSEEAGSAKPAPEFFDYALERMGTRNLDEMLIIGDSLSSDIAGGTDYGIDTCWYNPGHRINGTSIVPDFEIDDWQGLFEILSSN